MGDDFALRPEVAMIPVISMWQPWASLKFAYLDGIRVKPDETRDWPFPARLRGRDVVIHAAKHPISRDDILDEEELGRLCVTLFGANWRKGLPFGAYLGKVRFEEALSMITAEPLHDLDDLCGYWAPSRWAWRTADPRLFAEPIPAKGQQGFWSIPAADVAQPPPGGKG